MTTEQANNAHATSVLSLFERDLMSFQDARDRLTRVARITENPEPLAQLHKAHHERDAKRSAQGLL